MTNRRDFLAAAGMLAGSAVVPGGGASRRSKAPRVEARATLFYRQPDATSLLVRFLAHDVNAPGGRLRVYSRRQELLGTAAMLRRGDSLYGELWLPAAGEQRLSTLFEAPGLGRVIRSQHSIIPGRRWKLHIATSVSADDLVETLHSLPTVRRAIQAALYRRVHATSDFLRNLDQLGLADHMPFLRTGIEARNLERELGIPVTRAVYFARGEVPLATVSLTLANAGVQVVGVEREAGEPFQWWRSANETSPLVLAIPPGGTSSGLALGAGRNTMAERIERWLEESPLFLSPTYDPPVALIVHDGTVESLQQIVAAAAEWNATYAYPSITFNQVERLRDEIVAHHGVYLPVSEALNSTAPQSTSPIDPVAFTKRREAATSERTRQLIAALAGTLDPAQPTLTTIAERIDTVRPGTLVFNPSPFPRSDLVQLTDGSEQFVTDVPALGYAYFPHHPVAQNDWSEPEDGLEMGTDQMQVRLDARTGAITSLMRRSDGFELVRARTGGLNALRSVTLERCQRSHLPNIAERLQCIRRGRGGNMITTTVTAYESLPWIDIENRSDVSTAEVATVSFAFGFDNPTVRWEIPAGHDERDTPVERITHLRWIQLSARSSDVLFRALDTPEASVTAGGLLISSAPLHHNRFRIGFGLRYSRSTAPWRFGWQTEPVHLFPVPGSTTRSLPRFGSILAVDRAGVTTLGLKPADDGHGLILYLQDIIGVERSVSVRPGLLEFGRAQLVDFWEQETGKELAVTEGRIGVPLSAWGVAAVRLEDVKLAQG